MKSDMALAVFMDGCAARYSRSPAYQRKLQQERPGHEPKKRTRRTAA